MPLNIEERQELVNSILEKMKSGGVTHAEILQLQIASNDLNRLHKHRVAKGNQKNLSIDDTLHQQIKELFKSPETEEDKDNSPGSMEFLVLNLLDCMERDSVEDTLHVLFRITRKVISFTPGIKNQLWPLPPKNS